ncbi:protein spire1-like, partial [Scleropages formosus]
NRELRGPEVVGLEDVGVDDDQTPRAWRHPAVVRRYLWETQVPLRGVNKGKILHPGCLGVLVPRRSLTSEDRRSLPPMDLVIESLGIMVYKALDYGLKESEERELSPPLERLIDLMTNMTEGDSCPDEGYEATEEEDEGEEDLAGGCSVRRYRDILKLCTSHLPSPSDAPSHYQAVCRALYAETKELRTFLEKIRNAKENLRKMEGEQAEEPARDLNELQNADWRYKLRKVMVAARKLKPHPQQPQSLHERILEEIKAERKLRPVSPEQIRRSRLVIRPLSMSYSFDLSDMSTSESSKKKTLSALALANGEASAQSQRGDASASQVQRKRLLKAPTLAELDSSESDDETTRRSASSSSISTSVVEDTSPESAVGKKSKAFPSEAVVQTTHPSMHCYTPERRQTPQRRHSIEKETPTNVRHFLPPTRQSSKSLEEFCYPVECLALTVEEVMHIRQVLVKAELEKFQQYRDVYNALKKGKLCFCCRTKRFSFFTWSYTCQFCKRPVCSQCCQKMRLPSKPYASLPIYSLGPSTLPKAEVVPRPERPSSSLQWQGLHPAVSRLSKQGSRSSTDEADLPEELTEDWSTMEVCVDCKKFISDIISSSKRSLSLATKRARLRRKTQSFYGTSANTSEYRPSERTIKEV